MSENISDNTNNTFRKCLTYSGFIYLFLLVLALLAGGFVPPAAPSWSQSELFSHLKENNVGVLLCGILFVMCSPLYITFSVSIASYMRQYRLSEEMVIVQVALAVLGSITFLVCGIVFVVVGFRVEDSAAAVYYLHDFAWVMMLLPWPPFLLQNIVIGIGILKAQDNNTVIPPWVGYLNFWVAVSFIPSTFLCFFKSGPFAWDGILVFWLAASVFALWFLVMGIYLLKDASVTGYANKQESST